MYVFNRRKPYGIYLNLEKSCVIKGYAALLLIRSWGACHCGPDHWNRQQCSSKSTGIFDLRLLEMNLFLTMFMFLNSIILRKFILLRNREDIFL